MYKIVYTKLVQWLLPVWLRNSNVLIIVLAANYPLREAYNKFITYKDAVQYKLDHSFETCSIQSMLNDSFDPVDRRIRIKDFESFGDLYLYAEADNNDMYLSGDVYLYGDDTGYDFTIQIPSTIVTIPAQLAAFRAKVNVYRLAGKQYFIERI